MLYIADTSEIQTNIPVAMETAIWQFGKFDRSSILHEGMFCTTNLVDTFSNCLDLHFLKKKIGVLHVLDGIDLDHIHCTTHAYK